MKDKDFYLIQEAYEKVNEQNKPNWLYQPLKRLSTELGDWQLRRMNPAPTQQTVSQIPSNNNAEWEAEQQRRANMTPEERRMEKTYGGKENVMTTSETDQIYAEVLKKNREYLDTIKQRFPLADHSGAEIKLSEINRLLSVDLPKDPQERENLLAVIERERQNIVDDIESYLNSSQFKQQYDQYASSQQQAPIASTGDSFQDAINRQRQQQQQFTSQPVGTIRINNPQAIFTATK